jgi:hypothetical protein
MAVAIPNDAVDSAKDISVPSVQFLRDLSLLPAEGDLAKAKGAKSFLGPPSSVAIIEAGATALSKAWALGLATFVGVAWGAVLKFWGANPDQRSVMLWAASITTAALVVAIGYIVASDVRGRAAAMVATYEARADIAIAVIAAAREASKAKAPPKGDWEERALPEALVVENTEPGVNPSGWAAFLIRSRGDEHQYFLVKDNSHRWVDAARVRMMG